MTQRTVKRVGGWQRVVATAALVAAAGVVIYAHDPFSLVITFRSTWNVIGGCGGDGVCGDANDSYQDLTDGVEAWSNAYGNIQLVATASPSRRLCVDFPSGPTKVYDTVQYDRFVGANPNALDGCYPGTFNTLANETYGATDIGLDGVANPLPISSLVYVMINGVQYELQWRRQPFMQQPDTAPPLKVTYTSQDRWGLASFLASDPDLLRFSQTIDCPRCSYVYEPPPPTCPEGCMTLSVNSPSKPRGRVLLANFVMPTGLDAERAGVNQRRKRGM